MSFFLKADNIETLRNDILDMNIDDVEEVFNSLHPNITTNKFDNYILMDMITKLIKNNYNNKAIILLWSMLMNTNLFNYYDFEYFTLKDIYKFRIVKNNCKILTIDVSNNGGRTRIYDYEVGDKIEIINEQTDKTIITFEITDKINKPIDIIFIKSCDYNYICDYGYIKLSLYNLLYKINIDIEEMKQEIIKNNVIHSIPSNAPISLDHNDKLTEYLTIIKNDNVDEFILKYNKQYEDSDDFEYFLIVMIKYIIYYNAVKIFKFLYLSDVINYKKITAKQLITINNLEMFKLLENKIENIKYYEILKEAIIFKKRDIINYCLLNLEDNLSFSIISEIIKKCLIYHDLSTLRELIEKDKDKYSYNYGFKFINDFNGYYFLFIDEIRNLFDIDYIYNNVENIPFIIECIYNNVENTPFIFDYSLISKLRDINKELFDKCKFNFVLSLLHSPEVELNKVKDLLFYLYGTNDINIIYEHTKINNKSVYNAYITILILAFYNTTKARKQRDMNILYLLINDDIIKDQISRNNSFIINYNVIKKNDIKETYDIVNFFIDNKINNFDYYTLIYYLIRAGFESYTEDDIIIFNKIVSKYKTFKGKEITNKEIIEARQILKYVEFKNAKKSVFEILYNMFKIRSKPIHITKRNIKSITERNRDIKYILCTLYNNNIELYKYMQELEIFYNDYDDGLNAEELKLLYNI